MIVIEPAKAIGKSSWLRNSATLSPRARTSTTSNGVPTSTTPSTIALKIGGLGRRALIDTSVAVRLKESEFKRLLPDSAISTLTLAEMVRGLHSQVGIDTLDLRSVDQTRWAGCDRAESYAFAE